MKSSNSTVVPSLKAIDINVLSAALCSRLRITHTYMYRRAVGDSFESASFSATMTLTLVDGQTQLPDYPVNSVKLSVANDSKITSVNLYSQHAEVSRSFQLKLASGQNNVAISDFSDCVDEESIRSVHLGTHIGTITQLIVIRDTGWADKETPPSTTSPRAGIMPSNPWGLHRCKILSSGKTYNESARPSIPVSTGTWPHLQASKPATSNR